MRLLPSLLLLCPMLCQAGTAPVRESDGYNYGPAVGWYWYNLPVEKDTVEKVTPPAPLTPTQQLAQLHQMRQTLLNNAVMHPTSENIRKYKVLQDFLVEKASLFSARWAQVLLENPELDYNLRHPIYNSAAPIEYARERQAQTEAIRYVNQRYGVFFFYRGNEPLDNKLGGIIREFSQQYDIPFIPVTMDDRINPDLPDSRRDNGQAARMNIRHFPAIYLVDPGKQTYRPLAYGFITQDDLARRMLNVVTDFAPRD